jgi:hypothetical protein
VSKVNFNDSGDSSLNECESSTVNRNLDTLTKKYIPVHTKVALDRSSKSVHFTLIKFLLKIEPVNYTLKSKFKAGYLEKLQICDGDTGMQLESFLSTPKINIDSDSTNNVNFMKFPIHQASVSGYECLKTHPCRRIKTLIFEPPNTNFCT